MHRKAEELQDRISIVPGLSLKQCSDTHYQVLNGGKPIANFWPTTSRWSIVGSTSGNSRATVTTVDELVAIVKGMAERAEKPEGPTAYEFTFSANLAKVLPSVGKIIDEVNGHMADFGFHEKMILRGPVQSVVMSGVRRLSKVEQDFAGQTLLQAIQQRYPEYEWQLDSCVEVKGNK